MRKMIETISTLALWAVWVLGSASAISEFLSNPIVQKKIENHLWIIGWSPEIAFLIFTSMMLAVRNSKMATDKKTMPSAHTVQWTIEHLKSAQYGKFIDLHFAGSGLDCQVKIRDEQSV